MSEIVSLLGGSLFLVTACVIVFYFRKMREVSRRYVEAKSLLGDIVLSFKSDLERQEEKLSSLSQRVVDLPLREDESKKIDGLGAEIIRVEVNLKETSDLARSLRANVESLTEKVEAVLSRQKADVRKFSEAETKERTHLELGQIEAAIPIRTERALARLTETELKVLQILVNEGDKTASQIKGEIGLTREHTARLMKTLYTRGYVERATERLPYLYRVKDEMTNILRKTE